MSSEQTTILEFPIETGQNEGTERAVLPVGEFSALQNARYRKSKLLGKRNGYTSKSSLDSSGAALGNGGGRLSTLGPEFCVVDDRFYRRDTLADNWSTAPSFAGTTARNIPGRFPQFMPGPIIEPTTQDSLPAASDQYAGMTYALGYIWTAESRAFAAGGWAIHVEARDPATSGIVFVKDIELTGAANTDEPGVQLLSTLAGTVVLLTDRFTAGTKSSVVSYTLTSLAGGFSAGTSFTCIESAANYNTYNVPARTNAILFAYSLTGTPNTVTVGWFNPVTMTAIATANYAVGGAKTLLSVFGSASGIIRLAFTAGAAAVISQAYDTTPALLGTVDWTAAGLGVSSGTIMFAEQNTVTDTVFGLLQSNSVTAFIVGLLSNTGGLTTQIVQKNAEMLSQPFRADSQVYVWARYVAGEELGVASLLRVPLLSEYSPTGLTTPGTCPLQATVDDRDVHTPLIARQAGPPFPTPLSTPLGYVALINYTRDTYVGSGGITFRRRSFALVPVRHRAEGIRYAASCVLPVSGKQFVAAAQPMWVDHISAYEAGFIQAPLILSTTPGAGGSLTANSAYAYAVVYQSVDGSSSERSGPSVPATISAATMGANTKITLTIAYTDFGYRRQISARIYRTLANGSVFQFVDAVDVTPGVNTATSFTYIDTAADSDVSQNETLYVNIGQEQAASNFPACSFANTGGGRLWVGGGFTGNIGQASKRFLPRLAPEFTDDDAWRVPLPDVCTGSAWLDAQVWFTQNSIHVTTGDGPDVAGEGSFSTSELPFNIGCIDWRSVAACDLGVFFQTARGLYMLPRGFGQPIAMDQVLDTLTTYPVITAARSNYNSSGDADNSEQLVQWCAVADEAATVGVIITFDVAYKCFYVDTFEADFPATFLSGWSGEAVQAPATMTIGPNGASHWHPFRIRDASYDDEGLPIPMFAATGDVRPFGIFGHGVIHRTGILAKLRSACSVEVQKTTDKGSQAPSRTYDGITPAIGDTIYLDAEQGASDQKDVTSLRLGVRESSTTEGVSLVGVVIEIDTQKQNFKLPSVADRIC